MSSTEPAPRWERGRGFWPKIGLSLVATAGLAFVLDLGAEICDHTGDARAPIALLLETYSRNPEGKHRCRNRRKRQRKLSPLRHVVET